MALKKFSFNVIKKHKYARRGQIVTSHGLVDTPCFMPVGTQGTVKAIFPEDLIVSGTQIILSNTYHLLLRPGVDRISSLGGLHQFMNCKLPILTDSGGFQIMSLSKLTKIDKNIGAIFKSHIDGREIILSPEESINIQKKLNSDILMVLDECPKITNDKNIIKQSMDLSLEWALRSKNAFGSNPHKGLFGIVQGGLYKDLRLKCLEKLIEINFDGFALGGLAVGETQDQMFNTLDAVKDYMPKDKPRYLMGVGTPSDILGAVKRGMDMFDCVLPTRSGRTGLAFTWNGKINIRNSKFKNDNAPLDDEVTLCGLNKYSKNYLNHLFNTNEILGSMLLTIHNINFYQQLMKKIRETIVDETFDEFYDKYFEGVPLDLSKALVIFTFNDRARIDPILLDRMTVIKTEASCFRNYLAFFVVATPSLKSLITSR